MQRHTTRNGLGGGRSAILILSLLLSAMVAAAFPAFATVTQVSSSPNNDNNPVIRGRWIAWTSTDATGHSNVVVYDIATGTTTQVTNSGSARLQSIDGDNLVYSDLSGTNSNVFNVFVYDLSTNVGRQLTTDAANQFNPSISGSLVVWDDDRASLINTDIWGVSLSGGSEFQVTTNTAPQDHPSISGTLVAWQDLRNGPPNVFAIDLAGGSEFAVAAGSTVNAQSPRVDAGRIVYSKMTVAGVFNIFVWDATHGERQVSTSAFDERVPRISGNRVVWEDYRNQATTGIDLYGADLSNLAAGDVAVDTEPLDQALHDVDGTNVVFADFRNGNYDIFLLQIGVGSPATLTLSPLTATNTVGTPHCVTATVKDASSNPTADITVIFNVLGAQATFSKPSSGSATTDSFGEAKFCFTASLPGDNVIHAFADTNNNGTEEAPGEPSGNANKTWTPPGSTEFCVVTITDGGWIVANNGDRANFGGNAKVLADGTVQGSQRYTDQGPMQPMDVKSIALIATTCNDARTTASIFGRATIDGAGSHVFRIDVTDMSKLGSSDSYGITLDTGYMSGQHVLGGGQVTIH